MTRHFVTGLFEKENEVMQIISESLKQELEQCRDRINGALELLSRHLLSQQSAMEDDELYSQGPQGAD